MAALQRIPWSEAEDEVISNLVEDLGTKHWTHIAVILAERFPGVKRSSKQCRERWVNHLDPTLRKAPWSDDELMALYKCHQQHGNQWAVIAAALPGRTDNSVKSRLYTEIRKFVRCFNIGKPAALRILRSMRSLLRDTSITKTMLEFYGYSPADLVQTQPTDVDLLEQQFIQFKQVLDRHYPETSPPDL